MGGGGKGGAILLGLCPPRYIALGHKAASEASTHHRHTSPPGRHVLPSLHPGLGSYACMTRTDFHLLEAQTSNAASAASICASNGPFASSPKRAFAMRTTSKAVSCASCSAIGEAEDGIWPV